MTNYEKIKIGDIDEVARLLCGITDCLECEFYNICDNADGFKKWLESEAEE